MRLLEAIRAPGITRIGGAAWSVLWAVLAVLHVTQAIWLSAGKAWPGGLGDGRFNQLVLEHGYQSLWGGYDWSSPGQFHPATGTLGYSDTHAGTLPIYALLRTLGYSIDHSWQGWFMIVTLLNVVAAFRLFAGLAVGHWLRGPLVFVAVGSVTMVWLAGTHMQMLPCFPILFAWGELVRWGEDRARARLFAAGGWIAWQFAAGPYLAFFGLLFTVVIGLLRGVGRNRVDAVKRTTSRRSVFAATGVALGGGVLAIATVRLYANAIHGGAGRSMDEVRDLAPRLASWFTASPAHRWYPEGWPGAMSNHVEHAWLAGFLPWLLLAPALVVGWRHRRTAAGAWLVALAGGALIVPLFFTAWGEPARGAWIFSAERFEPLRAFRASGRVAGLLQVVQTAAAAVLLTVWWRSGKTTRAIAVALTCAMVVESLGGRQPATEVAVAEKRAHALIAAWRTAGDRPVLAYAFGYTNLPDVDCQLDAWSAALRLHRRTVNGYSGGMPGSHQRFLWNATTDNARSLIAAQGLRAEDVSIVERLSAADDAALGIVHLDGKSLAHLDEFDLQPVSWTLYAFIERHVLEDVPMYQFTPDAEVRFRLPDDVREVTYLVAFRPGAYTQGGRTDGSGVTWSLQSAGAPEVTLSYELIAPLTRPEHRGLLPRSVIVPPGKDRVLILRTDAGPEHNTAWDWPVFGRLHRK